MPPVRDSRYYRRRADQLRVAAIEMLSSDNHDTLLWFAADFDRMAIDARAAEQAQNSAGTDC